MVDRAVWFLMNEIVAEVIKSTAMTVLGAPVRNDDHHDATARRSPKLFIAYGGCPEVRQKEVWAYCETIRTLIQSEY